MKRKGFTLVELLAVIIILGVIVALTTVQIISSIDNANNKAYEALVKSIEGSTELYMADHSNEYPTIDQPGAVIYIKLQDLVDDGYLNAPVKDPKEDKNIPLQAKIKIVVINEGNIDITYMKDSIAPVIVFETNGHSSYIKRASTKVDVIDDSGIEESDIKYLWTTSTNTPVETDFSVTFSSGDTINSSTNLNGGYYLWILAKDVYGNTTITGSNVFNLDNTIPVITMLGSSPVSIDQGSTYTDAGATATDNIDGTITANISTVSTVNPSVGGTYTVTYNVSDTAGNTATPVVRTIYVIAPIPIYTMEQLASIGTGNTLVINGTSYIMSSSSGYILMNNISITTTWIPLTTATAFSGTFDGSNYTISGVNNSSTVTSGYVGLFGNNAGTIKNLIVSGTLAPNYSTNSVYIGLIAGYNDGTITNCHSSGSVTVSYPTSTVYMGYGGGLVGSNSSSGTITNSDSSATMGASVGSRRLGGLVGNNGGTITSSYASGSVTISSAANFAQGGGLVGNNTGSITSSYATGATSVLSSLTDAKAGGLVGGNSGGTITNSYATGNVSATFNSIVTSIYAYAGGLIGHTAGAGSVKNCFAKGSVTANGYDYSEAGGLIGYLGFTRVYNSYARGTVQATSSHVATSAKGYAGGFAGYVTNSGYYIYNSYATGNVTASAYNATYSYVGGFLGYHVAGTVADLFWNSSATITDYTTSVSVWNQGFTGTNTYVVSQTAAQLTAGGSSFTGYGGTTYTDALTALNAYVTGNSGLGLVSWARNASYNNGYPYLVGITPAE